MCGIFGLIIQKTSSLHPESIKRIYETLVRLSESRGTEASGIAISVGENTWIHKRPIRGTQLIKTSGYRELMDQIINANQKQYPLIILGHSRIATNGPLTNNKNNQPVVGATVLVTHNGITVNDDLLWKKYPHLKRKLLVDTEIIAALYEHYRKNNNSAQQTIQKIYKEIIGEASIAVIETKAPYLSLATNTGSLYYIQGNGFFLFASERYILTHLVETESVLPNSLIKTITQISSGKSLVVHLTTPSRPPSFDRPIQEVSPMKQFQITSDLYRNTAAKLKHHAPDYEAIAKITRCAQCIMPSTMPLIRFDSHGVCNFCRSYKKQQPLGIKALQSYISPYRSGSKRTDSIVALSGGRDSSFGLHFAKKILHLNPLAYTYDWGMVTDAARRNQSRMCAALGVEHIWVSADIAKKRDNIRKNIYAWLAKPDLGMVTLLMAGDKQAEYYAEELKRKTNLKLTIYCRGNQLEDERFKFGYYGIFDGTPKGVIHNLSWKGKLKMLRYYGRQFALNKKYINLSLIDTAWAYASAYLMPHDFLYLWHYIAWNEEEIVTTLKSQYAWETPADTTATWRIDDGTPPFYNYIYYHVQGFTENDGLRSNQIREGVITRKKALELVNLENKPRYESLAWYFDVLRINGSAVLSSIDAITPLYQQKFSS